MAGARRPGNVRRPFPDSGAWLSGRGGERKRENERREAGSWQDRGRDDGKLPV